MKKIFFICIVFAAVLLCACARTDTAVALEDPSEVVFSVEHEEICLRENGNGEYALYLPAFAREDNVRLKTSATIDGKAINAGEKVSLRGDFTLETAGGEITVKYFRSENIPAVFIKTESGSLDAVNASTDHTVSDSGRIRVVSALGETVCDAELKKIKGRGNSTWNDTPKKPYNIEFTEKTDFLGLGKAKKFVLLANFYDPSLLRNRIAFELARDAEGASPSCAPADVYENGRYIGSYLVCDKLGISKNAIDIEDLEEKTEKLLPEKPKNYERGGETKSADAGTEKWYKLPKNPSDITGGYLLEVDYPERYPDEASGFVTKRGLPVVIKSPEFASKEQVEYIREYFCDFEDALFSEDGYNKKGRHYSDYADVGTLVFRYLFEEFTLNIDGGIASFHIYKDTDEKGGKLNFSYVWDYDCALGNYNKYADLTSPEALFVGGSERRNNGSMPNIFFAMLAHPEIKERVREYYNNGFSAALDGLAEKLADLKSEIAASAAADLDLYGSYELRKYYRKDAGDDFESAFDILSDFITRRIVFFNEIFK